MKSFEERVLQDNEDYRVELVEWKGRPGVKKQTRPTTPEHRAQRLQNEIYAMKFLADLAAKRKNLCLYVPKLYQAADNYFIREYVDSEPVFEPEMSWEQAAPRLDRLAQLLSDIDGIKPYGEVKFVGHFDYHDIRKNFPNWTKQPLSEGIITTSQLDQLNKMVDELEVFLEPRFAHGDLLPHSHAFLMESGMTIALIDLENFSPAGMRYYDVANCYNRLFRYAKTIDTAKYFLSLFLAKAKPVEHRDEKILMAMIQRVVGMQYDAWYDARKGTDYRQRAAELFNLVLQGRLELLYS